MGARDQGPLTFRGHPADVAGRLASTVAAMTAGLRLTGRPPSGCATGIGDVARRAGISLATFYGTFGSKDACIFAGYDRFIEVLLGTDGRGLRVHA